MSSSFEITDVESGASNELSAFFDAAVTSAFKIISYNSSKDTPTISASLSKTSKGNSMISSKGICKTSCLVISVISLGKTGASCENKLCG